MSKTCRIGHLNLVTFIRFQLFNVETNYCNMSALNGISGTYCSILNNVKSCPGINIKFVRYRKPRFVPKAPSKLYRVKEPNKVDPVESPLIGNWQNRYNTEVKSIR